MEGFGQLFAFSLVMLFGSYIAGSVPLFMSMSEEKLHLVSRGSLGQEFSFEKIESEIDVSGVYLWCWFTSWGCLDGHHS